ncbi:MAG: 50S ribosomal protein L22 [Candidatus Omnitrophica bacterium]|nr:50S ribosomal protein L22 [Candidatus Omnitrophota bacterium]
MISQAKGKYIPVAPRKIRAVARLIRGLDVPRAGALLRHLPKGAARPIEKVFRSAVTNATRGGAWTEEQLVISKIMTDQGPVMKRLRAASMGRGVIIRKKFSHLTIELDVKKGKATDGS